MKPLGVVAAAAMLWVAGVMLYRSAPGPAAPGRAPEPFVFDSSTGDGELKITQFYAGTARIYRGENVNLCYGVANARAVRIEPAVDGVAPAVSRCVAAQPSESTTYTLLVTGRDGKELSRSLRVEVAPPPPRFVMLATSGKDMRRGEYLAICYGVEHAATVRLDPMGTSLPPLQKFCTQLMPQATYQYTLTATSPEGRTAQEKFTVKVR
jgi:hypothetical protein